MRTPQLADNLRRAVLQAAIEGKLNDRTSEDARDLLTAIQTEKTAQQKTGKLKKNKPLAAISEEEIPFAIPENWVWVRLGDIFNISRGGSPRPIQQFLTDDENGINWIKIGDTDIGGKYIRQTKEKIIRDGMNKSRFIKADSLLLTNSMSYGRPYILKTDGCIHDGWLSLEPLNENIDREYAFYVISSHTVQSQFHQTVAGAVVKNLNSDKVKETLIPLPPLSEQQQIVAKLNQLLTEIDNLKTQEQALLAAQNAFPKKLRAALLQAAMQGELNERTDENARDLFTAIQAEKAALQKAGKLKKDKPLAAISEEEIPFAIPDNWVWVRLGEIGETNIGLTYDKKDISDNGTIVLRSGNIQNDKIDLSDVVRISSDITQSKMCRKGDILICARNGSKSLVGKAAIINEEGFSFGAFMAVFRSSFNPYIFYYLHSPLFRSAFDGVGTTTINQITQDNLRNRLIPLPPLTEQQQIVTKLEALLAEIDILENAS